MTFPLFSDCLDLLVVSAEDVKTRDVDKDLTPKDQDKDKDLTPKDQDKDLLNLTPQGQGPDPQGQGLEICP